MKLILAATVAVLASCGGEDFECAIGELTGTWRFSYDEQNGNCGPIADETAVFDPGAPTGCDENYSEVSADSCRLDLDFECPLADGQGSQQWVMVVEQTADDRLDGTATVQVSHPTIGTCRSTYDIVAQRL
jgi:hypothetical protein